MKAMFFSRDLTTCLKSYKISDEKKILRNLIVSILSSRGLLGKHCFIRSRHSCGMVIIRDEITNTVTTLIHPSWWML
jgi:hypothetical protein